MKIDLTEVEPLAYSYIRFSTAEQAMGDSLRRQTQAAVDWCARHGVRLDTSLTLRDLGKSAYTGEHRKNPERHALAAFLKLVEAGKIPRGSFLIIENLDRLSREHIQPALLLALNLLQAGIRLVQLKPAEMTFDDKSEAMQVMMMVMELSRGHGESAMKSERVGAAWQEKKRLARESGTVLSVRLPAWVELRPDGKLHLIPERARVVRQIFRWATERLGHAGIVKALTDGGVAPFGKPVVGPGKSRPQFSGRWTRPYVRRILDDRRAVGEYQPCGRGRKPEGDPIPNYFPPAVTEEEYRAAKDSIALRMNRRGRVGSYINLFSSLLHNARDSRPYYVGDKGAGRVIFAAASADGAAPCQSFPLVIFEAGLLKMLKEIDPSEVTGGGDKPDKVMVLSAELAQVETVIASITQELDENGESPTLYARLRQKETRKAELDKQLALARREAAHPLSESWGEARTLLEVLSEAPDREEARLRLRSALRRVVDGIWLLVVRNGRDAFCAAQVYFKGDGRRDYLIWHRPPRGRGKGGGRVEGLSRVCSLADVIKLGDLDLRRRADAAALEQQLLAEDLDKLLSAELPKERKAR